MREKGWQSLIILFIGLVVLGKGPRVFAAGDGAHKRAADLKAFNKAAEICLRSLKSTGSLFQHMYGEPENPAVDLDSPNEISVRSVGVSPEPFGDTILGKAVVKGGEYIFFPSDPKQFGGQSRIALTSEEQKHQINSQLLLLTFDNLRSWLVAKSKGKISELEAVEMGRSQLRKILTDNCRKDPIMKDRVSLVFEGQSYSDKCGPMLLDCLAPLSAGQTGEKQASPADAAR